MSTHAPNYQVGYIQDVFTQESVAKLLPRCVKLLKLFEFDAIAFRGMSGALVAAPLSYLTGKPMIMVRKEGTEAHSSRRVEGDRAARTYIIADDFVKTGRTVEKIVEAVADFSGAKCVGVLTATDVKRHFDCYKLPYKQFRMRDPELPTAYMPHPNFTSKT